MKKPDYLALRLGFVTVGNFLTIPFTCMFCFAIWFSFRPLFFWPNPTNLVLLSYLYDSLYTSYLII